MDMQTSLIAAIGLAFSAGVVSFFSPCVLPLLPVYVAYLSGYVPDESESPKRSVLIVNTLLFVAGIGVTFFLLGLAATSLGGLLTANKEMLSRIGGLLIIALGLYQLGVFGSSGKLSQEHRLSIRFDKLSMNPAVAFLFGLAFSFAWTPCIGPVLASIIVAAGTAQTQGLGMVLILAYTLGLSLPFIVVALLAGRAMDFISSHKSIMAYTVKAGGIIMVVVGVLMVVGLFNAPGAQDDSFSRPAAIVNTKNANVAPGFQLEDIHNTSYSLEEYRGKTVVLNFWATWCGYCVKEIPSLQEVYEQTGENTKDVIFLSIANPTTSTSRGNDGSVEEVVATLKKHGGNYPVLMDIKGSVFRDYKVQGLPKTVVIDKDGNIVLDYPGMIDEANLKAAIARASAN